MSSRGVTVAVLYVLALVGCGGGNKPADSPGTCPDGTVLKGSDCVPSDDSSSAGTGSASKKDDDDGDKPASGDSTPSGGGAAGGGGGGGGGGAADAPPAGAAVPYDKDAVGIELKRAARQIKANCGGATDTEGKATGPWGKSKVNVVLGRNGHVRAVTVASELDGKPAGLCVVNAFKKIQFPPYAGSADATVDWDIELQKH